MSELRWNPMLGQWVIVAGHRQDRPDRPEGWCPFCPGSEKVPDRYDVCACPNDFPSLMEDPPEPEIESSPIYPVERSKGVCEVVLYSPEHDLTLTDLSPDHIVKLIGLWQQRYEALGSEEFIKYVLIFENKGEIIGVTMTHPHGQIFAYPFIPPRPQRELDNERRYWTEKGRCLGCDMTRAELEDGRRIVVQGSDFLAFVPFFAAYPYEVHVYPRRHIQSLSDLTVEEVEAFAAILKAVLEKYDNLFGFSFPYMMILNQKPTDGLDYAWHHFRIEFYPPLRDSRRIKYIAGSETGSGVQVNPTDIEARARHLRAAKPNTV